MQCDIDLSPGHSGVLVEKPTEWIKRCVWICGQQCVPQPGLAHFANGQVLSLIARITETQFPVPRLKVISKFSHLTTQADVEELVPVSEFFTPCAGVVNAAKPNPGSQRNRLSVNHQCRVPNCEWIERILNWHTDAKRPTRPYGREISPQNVEWIGRKWHGCQR